MPHGRDLGSLPRDEEPQSKDDHKAVRKAYRDRVEKAAESPEALGKLTKWTRTRHNQLVRATPSIRHPDTQHELAESPDKAELFQDIFFSMPPEADLGDL